MDTRSFLARVVPAQGNYLTITWKSPGRGWAVRSYKLSQPEQIDQAVNLLHWAARKGADTYFALAAFNVGEIGVSTRGDQIIKAKREQANVHLIRTLVMDADVKREGDKKDPASTFPDRRAAITWLLTFRDATGFPLPNLCVNSGYGLHWYWLFEDATTLDVWSPLAQALKNAMLRHGWVGDTSPTIDGARILRPPGTVNVKSGAPVPVDVMPKFTAADYPNQQLTDALAPYMVAGVGAAPRRATGTGGATITSMLGPRPAHVTPGVTLNPAAHAGLESRFKFDEIAKRCGQVKLSLTNQGQGDPYPLWYLGHITLAVFTNNGKDFVHEISKGDPRYSPAETDAAVTRAEIERDKKGFGAPLCEHYDRVRPGVCDGCVFKGKIKSPLGLGVEAEDLPYGYRSVPHHGTPRIERYEGNKKDGEWVPLFDGEVSLPRLDELPIGGHRLTFTYVLAGRTYPVGANEVDMGHQMPVGYFARQGMAVTRHTVAHIGDFVMAWITQLRMQHVTRTEIVRPFGWNFDAQGNRAGLAIAGTLYRCDGAEEAVPGGDPKIAAMYRPSGELKHWRRAASLFEGGRADLQALIAASFGAPLVSLCGDVRGMSLNFWSTESGIGKSTGIKVGQSVWGDAKAMQSMRDTPNAVMRSLSEPRILIRYWDELRIRKDFQDDFVEMIFTIPQGKERARLQADTTLREIGEWETMLVFTSNRACQDYLLAKDDGTDSGMARLLEIEMAKVATPFDPLAGQDIKLCETNYGHAGREYARYIAANLPEVQARLAQVMKGLSDKLSMQRDERFSVTAISCIVVGALIAKQIGLFDFDVSGINKTLVDAFKAQRTQRSRRTMLSDAGGFDLEEIIGEFVYSQADYRLTTNAFSPGGSGRVEITGVKPRSNIVRLQIAEKESTVRIERSALLEWLRDRGRPASTIIEELKTKMGAKEHRRGLGGGTGYGGGHVWVLDIPLTGRLNSLVTDVGVRETLRASPADEVRDAAE